MNPFPMRSALIAAALSLFVIDLRPDASPYVTLGRDAQAIVGAPLTPYSAAGVARRTTRRVVAVEATAASAAAASAAAAAQQQVPAGSPSVGSVVAALPAGFTPVQSGGVEYQRCGNVHYRPAFQGNNLVYVVVPQP